MEETLEKPQEKNQEHKHQDHQERYKITCSDCGAEAEVPFKPAEGRPVYCRDCYQKHKPKRRY